jgi:hypothetical protein
MPSFGRSPAGLRKPFQLSNPERFLLAALIPLGSLASFLLPLGAGYDEEAHLARVWEMSAFSFVPSTRLGTEGFPYPDTFLQISYRREPLVRPVPLDFWSLYAQMPIDGLGYHFGPIQTDSVYSPVLLLPQTLVFSLLGRGSGLGFLAVYYAMRLAGLVSYVLLAWLAVRLVPFGKWTLAILAASPVAVYQAATISADPISNGIGLLFLAAILALATRKEMGLRSVIGLMALAGLLFTAKVNLVVLVILPFLLIPPSRFRPRLGYVILLVGVILLFALEVGGWSALAYYPRFAGSLQVPDPVAQLTFVVTSPVEFVRIVARDIVSNGPSYLRDWIASYGHTYWSVPSPVYLLYLIGLGASLLAPDSSRKPDRWTRIALVIVFAPMFLATLTSLYLSFTPVASPTILGVHGRYLLPAMSTLILALVGLSAISAPRAPAIAAVTNLACLGTFLVGSGLSIYVPCGTRYYRTGLCYQPVYKDWAPDSNYSEPLAAEDELTQEIVPECEGMTELRIWLDASSANPFGSTAVLLRDPAPRSHPGGGDLPEPDAAPSKLAQSLIPASGSIQGPPVFTAAASGPRPGPRRPGGPKPPS